MIMLARVVPYGGNAVRYALEKEKAKMVKVNHMPTGIDPTSIWYMMKHHCQLHQASRTVGRELERFMVTFVFSPSREESKDFTIVDWANLQDEGLELLDSIGFVPKGKKLEVKTNFRNSMNVGGLHEDSKAGILHLHVDCCRVDLDGRTNDVHDIHIRAIKAAEIINMRHGWKQPQAIRDMRKEDIAQTCENILRNMDKWDVDRFFRLLQFKGYEVKPRYDKKNNLVGYTVGKNASVFKASEIGRKYMVSQLEASWKKLHPTPDQVKQRPVAISDTTSTRPVLPVTPSTVHAQPRVEPNPVYTWTIFDIDTGSGHQKVKIPNAIKDVFFNEAIVLADNDTSTVQDVAHVAMLLFAGYVDAATDMSVSVGGGGSSPESGWGKKDDEDDLKYSRRCLQMAQIMCKPPSYRRGWRR